MNVASDGRRRAMYVAQSEFLEPDLARTVLGDGRTVSGLSVGGPVPPVEAVPDEPDDDEDEDEVAPVPAKMAKPRKKTKSKK